MTEFLKSNKSNCKDCYKCIRHCPIKSIGFNKEQAQIIDKDCILCGNCYVTCPQEVKKIVSTLQDVKMLVKKHKVIASIAPSFVAYFSKVGIESLKKSLLELGFFDVEETAIGATIVKKQYDKMLEEEKNSVIISSCCHSINLLIQKYYKEAIPYLADVVSPMIAHGIDIKQRYDNTKVVFIGPCISKKSEAETYNSVIDDVLTFDDLSDWLSDEKITPEKNLDEKKQSLARLFPITGGILKTMEKKNPNYTYATVDGVTNSIETIESILRGEIKNCFIEMSACVGSCINGPTMNHFQSSLLKNYCKVSNYAGDEDFEVSKLDKTLLNANRKPIYLDTKIPTPDQVKEILKKMGKHKIEEVLNCGSCGYDTCREKAIAVFQGKADLTMCLPFLRKKAENFSDNIIRNTPNGIIVLNEQLFIEQINDSALKFLNIPKNLDVLGEPIIRILDPTLFIDLIEQEHNIYDKAIYLAEYNKFIEFTLLYDKEYKIIICIMRDITEEQVEDQKKEIMRQKTIETADQVVEKQMRTVQEIALLLGETVAETKIALTKLKESISNE